MSNAADALAWALKVRGTSTNARLLLIMLALRVGDNGFVVWPSVRTLADDCDYSESTVKRAMRELVAAKLVDTLAAYRDNGGRSSNRYRLMVKTTHYLPGGKTVEVDYKSCPDLDAPPPGQADRGGGVNLTGGPGQADRGGGVTVDPCNMNSESRTDSTGSYTADGGEELDLGLPPLPAEPLTEDSIAAHVERKWAELVGRVPAVAPIRGGKLDDARRKNVVLRATKFLTSDETVLDVWDEVFRQIELSGWLCGEKPPQPGRDPFRLQLTWLLEHRNFTKTLEGKFSGGRNPTGRPAAGPGGKAAARVLERNRANREQRTGSRGQSLALPGGT